jgi:hypothetical protein
MYPISKLLKLTQMRYRGIDLNHSTTIPKQAKKRARNRITSKNKYQ